MDSVTWLVVGFSMALLVMTATLVYWPDLLTRVLTRKEKARIWADGYSSGVNDERQAAAIDWPEYRNPNRTNPYGKTE